MKKDQQVEKEFKILKQQLGQIKEIIFYTKVSQLWSHESAVRKKLKALHEMKNQNLKGFKEIYEGYRAILDDLSEKLLEDYNEKNKKNYKLSEIINEDLEGYLSSGIITVLMKTHISKKVAKAFETHFPANPKDEYALSRQIKRKVYLDLGETNTGKTYHALERLKQSQKGVYLAPLRILALEVYERLNEEGVRCHLLTGEEEIRVEGAMHISSTIEKLNLNESYNIAVIDEIQMIGDSQRGAAWTRALLGLQCEEIHICGAKNAETLLVKILQQCEDEIEIKTYTRNVPLKVEEEYFDLKGILPGDALITFSKKRVLEMGVNLPIRRIVFMDIKKFDGDKVRYLTSQEVKQIAGRAGRKGIYDIGYVNAQGGKVSFIKENILCEDEPIQATVIGPSEALLQIKELPLKEKLALWATREEKIDIYRKMDVRDYLIILELLKKYKLSEQVEWKLMKLPFDVGNDALCETFIDFIEQYFVRKEEWLIKPQEEEKSLESLETYYQKINLYYSFSKTFHIRFDEAWVYEERENVSEKINGLLVRIKI